MTYLCIPIFARTADQTRTDIAAAIAAGAEMIELRIDTLQDDAALDEIPAAKVPVIVTCRPTSEGGFSELPDARRIERLIAAAQRHANCLDVELQTIQRNGSVLPSLAGSTRPRLIASAHDFSGRPERLHNLLLEMDQSGCDIKKVAWTARTVRDNLEAFEIIVASDKPAIALCMGEAGVISRILAKKFNAFLTFASLADDAATAAGQISIAQMKSVYRWDKITPATKVHGVVAHPVGHSMSPLIHNAAFDAAGYDGIYVPFLVNPGYESFKAFMESFIPFAPLDLRGLSVTLPHKENALRYLMEKGAHVEALAARIGAVNTIIIDRAAPLPLLSGINTDYAAILDSVTGGLRCDRKDLSGMPVAVLGAGGTGRTAVAALASCGAKVVIYNRTPSKAAALAGEFAASVQPLEAISDGACRVYINTTSVGMHPNVEETPFGSRPPKLGPDQVVFDTIYNPMQTRLLRESAAAGAITIGGVEMFVQQAAAQFQAWTARQAPVDVMRSVIVRRLSSQH